MPAGGSVKKGFRCHTSTQQRSQKGSLFQRKFWNKKNLQVGIERQVIRQLYPLYATDTSTRPDFHSSLRLLAKKPSTNPIAHWVFVNGERKKAEEIITQIQQLDER